jgi:hypothetical protein
MEALVPLQLNDPPNCAANAAIRRKPSQAACRRCALSLDY